MACLYRVLPFQSGARAKPAFIDGGAGKKRITGGKLLWFKVASHLHRPVSELASQITYSEFLEWVEFLDSEEKRHTKTDHYYAMIASELRRAIVKDPSKVNLKDFLLEFKAVATPQEDPKLKAKRSKDAWLGAFQIKKP